MKKFAVGVTVFAIVCAFLFRGASASEVKVRKLSDAPQSCEILLETQTGQVLYSKNENAKVPIASITKEMTLLIAAQAIENGEMTLSEKVRVSPYAAAAEGATIWLSAGEEMTAGELLKAVVMNSANDACTALAEHLAGSEQEFVKLMNARARELGMSSTHYSCCTGLSDNNNYSTAKDTAVLTAELMKYNVLRGYFLTWVDYLRNGETQLVNTNKLVRWYDGLLGGKTGTTDAAGYCLAACAELKNMRLAAVVLGAESDDKRFERTAQLLDSGFSEFEKFTPEQDFTKLAPIKVIKGASAEVKPVIPQVSELVIPKGKSGAVKYEYSFVESLEAPVEKGQFVGEYLVMLDGKTIYTSEIVAAAPVRRIDFWQCLVNVFREIIRF